MTVTADGASDAFGATDRRLGLSSSEAAARLKAEGHNELPQPLRRTRLRIVLEVIRQPMFGLLLAAGAIYLVLGDAGEALILFCFATLSVSIAVIQESRTERVLEALRDLTSPRALVLRDGERRRIPGVEVVRGDLLLLAEGDRIPADAILIDGQGISVDESLLTGESVPVRKRPATVSIPPPGHPGGEDQPYLYAGALLVAGQGLAEVRATGAYSEIGKLGQALGQIESETPRLARELRGLVRGFAILALLVSLLAMLLFGLLRGGWLDALLGGIALGMSMLPEEIPLVLTVFMAMGAWRISQARVLTRRAAAIEALGAATVLCTDKTGTLTQNSMKIVAMYCGDTMLDLSIADDTPLPQPFADLAACGILASKPQPFDPMEKAFHALAPRLSAPPAEGHVLLHEFALSPDLLAMTNLWHSEGAAEALVTAKGAPEAIAKLCHLDAEAVARLHIAVETMAAQGMRVLAVAQASHGCDAAMPQSQSGFDFRLLGLVGLADPLRPSVPAAVQDCRAAGIRVMMITGDYPATAAAIARQAGIDAEHVVTGADMAQLDDAALGEKLRRATVFARILPQQKLRLVRLLQGQGEIVAMTGDGVNDAPSLKAAHIGIAMGGRGTDVAREASSIVLLDDDFASIARTIRLGRRIYDNLRKAIGYILAVHVPIAAMALLPLVFGWPLVLLPIHIAILEMVIDPICSVVFEAEAEEKDVMQRPPRAPDSPLFSGALAAWSLLQGLLAAGLVAVLYAWSLAGGMAEGEARAMAFTAIVTTNLALLFVNRSFGLSVLGALDHASRLQLLVLGGIIGLLSIALAWPAARGMLRFAPLTLNDLLLCLGGALLLLLLLTGLKPFWRRRLQS
ncbi:cation-translocating P-type ATPase [Ferrovibrio sp.]|uniref:cation-translocating P-type ATPase n=1 Tax=Ferrovibrio sp. TaxID=1917215 RepID=UPI001B706D66|nr:cation-translocating P-type ATPase [Ferrovibrio sp.]MBP7064506.1 cation-translocating P-type ATPase [Ferrovibrio sp.]